VGPRTVRAALPCLRALRQDGRRGDVRRPRPALRAERDLRLNLIRDEDTRAALIVLVYMVNLVLIPALVIVWALLRAHARKRREQLARAQRGGEL